MYCPNNMPPEIPLQSSDDISTREFFEVIRLGVGCDLSHRRLVDFLKEHGKRGREVIEQTRAYVKGVTGYEIKELGKRAQERSLPNTDSYRETRNRIRTQLLNSTPFLRRYNEEDRESGMRKHGLEANAYMQKLIVYYFPGEESAQTHPKVETCNDAADLVLMACDDNAESKVKFDAARKLLLMKYIGEIRDYSQKDEDHDRALQYMHSLFDEQVVELPEGAKIGATTTKYLVSRHEEGTYRTIGTEILDEKPDESTLDELTKVTPLEWYKTTVANKAGERRGIYYAISFRNKGDESRLIKALRYNAKVGERDVDRNGIRQLFTEAEDWIDFRPGLFEHIKSEVWEGLQERLETETDITEQEDILATLNDLDRCIEVTEPKNSLNGEGFNGSAPSSSEKLKVDKFKMRVTRADGRQHRYEYQAFLPDGFADEKYRKGVSWEEYNTNRFFEAGVDQLFFPEHIYSGINRKKAWAEALQRAHEKLWPKKPAITLRSVLNTVRDKAKALLARLPRRKTA